MRWLGRLARRYYGKDAPEGWTDVQLAWRMRALFATGMAVTAMVIIMTAC